MKPFKKFSSEDVIKEAETEVHKIFTKQTAELERVLKEKEKELMKWWRNRKIITFLSLQKKILLKFLRIIHKIQTKKIDKTSSNSHSFLNLASFSLRYFTQLPVIDLNTSGDLKRSINS